MYLRTNALYACHPSRCQPLLHIDPKDVHSWNERIFTVSSNPSSITSTISIQQALTDMADPDESGAEGIIARKMVFCPLLQEFDTDELIVTCEECKDFFVCCCSCIQHDRERPGKPCHHFRLVFTDGACSHNGQDAATSGIGIACGENEESQLTIPLTNSIDKGHKRTSQRAELWAALFGVICMTHVDQTDSSKAEKAVKKRKNHGPRDSAKALVVATDSEYVVKGMTEWLPPWKVVDALPSLRRFILKGNNRITTSAQIAIQNPRIWTYSSN